ncbi:EamA-like transporter family protein [Parashewanella spongiae]|uniref:EamA-like transporter family protein n=1 Tax=Parashewanella spongiae TaxID=342950 RepID=A0A3A6U037_9GAMM|nr:DMT family transporter [Parashewanella spongiae]MCL1078266.1 DMT family transporter [Parashewanella spongiae]RJY18788.1 EamA-like transporter family protein [Parashewanella spongiae]
MGWMISIALINGLLIGLCRSINGSLSQNKGPFRASFHNHWVGAATLTVIIFLFTSISVSSLFSIDSWQHVPALSLTGGILGALYVAINSHILSHIEALKAALFVISGQMITGVLLSISEQSIIDFSLQIAGVILIIIGMFFNLKIKNSPK